MKHPSIRIATSPTCFSPSYSHSYSSHSHPTPSPHPFDSSVESESNQEDDSLISSSLVLVSPAAVPAIVAEERERVSNQPGKKKAVSVEGQSEHREWKELEELEGQGRC